MTHKNNIGVTKWTTHATTFVGGNRMREIKRDNNEILINLRETNIER